MTDYILVGGGAFAREIFDWFSSPFAERGDRFVGCLDDEDQPSVARSGRMPRLGPIAGHLPHSECRLVMALANPAGKRAVTQKLSTSRDKVPNIFATLSHPSACVSHSAKLGTGCIIGPFADVSADASLEEFVTLNAYASAGHDVVIGPFSTLSGYVDLTGSVMVGESTFFGSGARVLPNLTIGRRCVIGAGAVVVRSTPDNVTLYAAPARVLR